MERRECLSLHTQAKADCPNITTTPSRSLGLSYCWRKLACKDFLKWTRSWKLDVVQNSVWQCHAEHCLHLKILKIKPWIPLLHTPPFFYHFDGQLLICRIPQDVLFQICSGNTKRVCSSTRPWMKLERKVCWTNSRINLERVKPKRWLKGLSLVQKLWNL